MTRSTSELRALWGPACETSRFTTIPFGNNGARITVDRRCVDAFNALAAVMDKHNYDITPPDVGAYVCRAITGGSNYSLHAYGIAVDINWQDNPYGPVLKTNMPMDMVREISPGIVTNNGVQVFRWGGDYSGNKDAMHFEVVASPTELAAGIKQSGGLFVTSQDKAELEAALSAHSFKLVIAIKQSELKVLKSLKRKFEKLNANDKETDNEIKALELEIKDLQAKVDAL